VPGRDRKLLRTDRASHRIGRMSMNRAGQKCGGHCTNRVKPRIVTTKTPKSRIRRNGFTPRSGLISRPDEQSHIRNYPYCPAELSSRLEEVQGE
jgi:hypothetical protein